MELGFKPCRTLKPILLSTAVHSILGTEEALVIGYSIWQPGGILQVPKMASDCTTKPGRWSESWPLTHK